ncbi:UNVERIFIED_CONTAM: hypothetical protein GTU68_052270 [Idotea baltica]|nr:hypothetical protein [Idotea baltica]
MQEKYEKCFFFIADYHSLTTHPDAKELPENVKRALSTYLGCGLDPEKCVLYKQSDIPQTAELYLILNMFAYKGELEKVSTFKDKIRQKNQTVNAGLLTYPVLMAADIIIHKASSVPVGKDQEQHLEMSRTFAQRFNHTYNQEYFPLPKAVSLSKELVKIPSLSGEGKMSKSDANPNNAIYLDDENDLIIKKIKKAKTDSGPTEKNSPISPELENLLQLMHYVSSPETIATTIDQYKSCTIRYGDLKKQLGEDMVAFIEPIRERINRIYKDDDYLYDIGKKGAEQAAASASKTIDEVRSIIGINSY